MTKGFAYLLRYSALCACVIILGFTSLLAQDDQLGEITFDDIKDNTKLTYNALGAGFTGNFLFWNKDNLNKGLTALGNANGFSPTLMAKGVTSPIFMTGVQGVVAVGIGIANLRLGFSGQFGTHTETEPFVDGTISGTRTLEVSSSFNGVSFDYGIPLTKGFAVLPGLQLGWGEMSIVQYEGAPTTSWGAITKTGMSRLQVTQYHVTPQLNIEYSIISNVMLRAYAGYALTFQGTWQANYTSTVNPSVSPAPEFTPSTFNSTGLLAGFGIFVGIF